MYVLKNAGFLINLTSFINPLASITRKITFPNFVPTYVVNDNTGWAIYLYLRPFYSGMHLFVQIEAHLHVNPAFLNKESTAEKLV